MSADAEHRFRTKTGYCRITAEQIILTREGARGRFSGKVFGNSIGRALSVYGLVGFFALTYGIWMITSGDTLWGILFGGMGAYYLFSVFSSRSHSATPVIERSAIRAVDSHPPRPFLTRGYFTIYFEEEDTTRKRIIMLPGRLWGGGDEYERAVEIMREAGLLKVTDASG